VYLLRDASAVKDLPAGSVVLFRYGYKIVGEAVVWKEKETLAQKVKNKTLTGVHPPLCTRGSRQQDSTTP
jgi:hypothetical protein